MEEGEVKRFILKLAPVYWRQLAPTEGLRRLCLIGVLKGEKPRPSKWVAYPSFREFGSALRKALEEGPVEVYGSLELHDLETAGVRARVLAFDVDDDENDLSSLKQVYEAWRVLRDELGVSAVVKLSGGGLHIEGPAIEGMGARENAALAGFIEKRLGGKVRFCRKIYSKGRMFRLAWSWHAARSCFATPLHPEWLLEYGIEELRERARDPMVLEWIFDSLRVGAKVVDAGKLESVLKLLAPPAAELKVLALKEKRRVGGWREAVDPKLGRVRYSARLEGYGWVRALIEEGCVLPDGRLTLCWLVLPEAAHRGVITLEEAKEYVRKSLEQHPDKPLEEYLKKLEYEFERQRGRAYGLPTWLSLIYGRKKVPGKREWSGEPLDEAYEHVKYPVLLALAEKGLVKLEPGQLEALKGLTVRVGL